MRLRLGEHGGRWLELDDWYASTGDARRFVGREQALRFLRGLERPAALQAMRTRLAERELGAHRLDDAAVIEAIAHALQRGALAVIERTYVQYAAIADEDGANTHVELPAPDPRLALRRPASVEPLAPAPTVEPALLPALELVAQVRALRQAASSGAPFCEICRRTGS